VIDAYGALGPQTDRTLGAAAVVSLPILAYAGLALLTGRRRADGVSAARGDQARRRALERLRQAEAAAAPGNVIYQALAGYLNERFGEADVGLTTADAARRLEEFDVDQALSSRVTAVLDACERARYGSATIEGATRAAMVVETEAVIRELDAVWGRKGRRP
jgi:hypothetical protein